MAGSKISALSAITTLADGDLVPAVDVSDASQAPSGSTVKITAANAATSLVSKRLATNAQAITGTSTTLATTPANLIYALPFTDARSYGPTVDGVADDTTEMQAAIDATPEGGTCFFAAGRWLFSTLTCTKSITLLGEGWHMRNPGAFGADFLNTAYSAGTVLISTATSGDAILVDHATIGHRVQLENFLLIGPGSGTSTGIQMGGTTGASGSLVKSVMICNFSIGMDIHTCLDSGFYNLATRGCETGLLLVGSNQNEFYNLEIQYSTVYGVDGRGSGAALNSFYGGLIQNCSGTAGMIFESEANHVYGFYCENSSPPTDIFVLNATDCSLQDSRIGSGSNGITIGTNARSCLLKSCRGAGTTPIALTGNAQGTTLINMDRGFVVTDSAPLSSNTTYIENGRVRAKTFEGIGPLLVGKTGEYWSPSCTRAAAAMTAGTVYAMPVIAAMSRPIVRIGMEVTIVGGAGCTITLGLYDDDELGVPSALFLDAGTIDGNSATAQEITINVTPEVGKVYHLAAMAIGGSPTVRVLGTTNPPPWMGCHLTLANATATNVFRVSRTRTGIGTAALPDPLAATSLSGTMPLIALRF